MKKLILILAVLVALVYVSSSVSAWFVNVGWDGGYIEVYRDGYWANSPDPYDYYYDNWYYYQEPYRYYYGGDYYYYEPGWYNYDYSWYSNPYSYSYYSSNYYYYDSYWNYYPGWYNYPSIYGYYGGYPSLVGSPYQYPKLADCSEIELNVYDKSITAGDVEEVTVWVNNGSIKNFQINSVSVYLDSFDLDKSREHYNSTVAAGKSGQITFELEADDDAKSDSVDASIKITGQFTDGTVCRSGDIDKEKFRISINGTTAAVSPTPTANDTGGFAYSTSTIIERNEEGGWVDVSPEGSAMVEGVTFEDLESGDYIRFAEEDNYIEGDCSGLGFEPLSINVHGEDSKTGHLYLRNYTTQNFYIDSVEVYDYSPSFASSAALSDSFIYSDSMGKIGISVDAFSSYVDGYGTAFVEVKGHFPSGKTCSLPVEEVDVYVTNNLERMGCDAFNLSVPDVLTIENSGEVNLVIDNPLDRGATINLIAEGLDLSTESIYIGPESLLEKTIYIENFSADKGWIFYNINNGDCSFPQKSTFIKKPVQEESAGVGIELMSVASKINLRDSGMVPISIRNNLEEEMFVELKIIDLPDNFYARQIIDEMPGKSSKTFNLEVFSGDTETGTYSGKLVVSAGNETIIRIIEFNVVNQVTGNEVEQEEGDEVSAGLTSTALAVLGGGTLIAGVIIIGLLMVLFIIGLLGGASKKRQKRIKAPEGRKKA